MWAFYGPRDDSSISYISTVTSIVGDTFAVNNVTQSTEILKPTYNDAGDYIQFGGIAGNQEELILPDIDFAGDDFSLSVWAKRAIQGLYLGHTKESWVVSTSTKAAH
ncbi:MAG: hypothetical protein COA45_03060 [Zetaproteobacteria bacterium]|nr:MAG: hypothetical protein COA45_03060 [Zetaproteobacteria bacterium]